MAPGEGFELKVQAPYRGAEQQPEVWSLGRGLNLGFRALNGMGTNWRLERDSELKVQSPYKSTLSSPLMLGAGRGCRKAQFHTVTGLHSRFPPEALITGTPL